MMLTLMDIVDKEMEKIKATDNKLQARQNIDKLITKETIDEKINELRAHRSDGMVQDPIQYLYIYHD